MSVTARHRTALIVDRGGAFSIWTLMNAVAGELVARGWRVGYAVLDDGVNTALPAKSGVRPRRARICPAFRLRVHTPHALHSGPLT